jgi:hypothetical protein
LTLLTTLLCVMATGTSPAPDAAALESPPAVAPASMGLRAEVKAGLSGGFRPGPMTGGGSGWLGFTYAITPVFRFEVDVGLGTFPTSEDLLTPIRIGTHIEWPREGLVPYLWLALAHNHEVKFVDAMRNPIPTVLGLSEEGVVHRTGLDLGVGMQTDLPVSFPTLMKDAVHTRFGVRLSSTLLLGAGPPASLDLVGTLGILF